MYVSQGDTVVLVASEPIVVPGCEVLTFPRFDRQLAMSIAHRYEGVLFVSDVFDLSWFTIMDVKAALLPESCVEKYGEQLRRLGVVLF